MSGEVTDTAQTSRWPRPWTPTPWRPRGILRRRADGGASRRVSWETWALWTATRSRWTSKSSRTSLRILPCDGGSCTARTPSEPLLAAGHAARRSPRLRPPGRPRAGSAPRGARGQACTASESAGGADR
ncbi:hypothetical protein QJS66_13365 [Kocuria rhizophila]|nr:hypothetical protein QJS66_13365 [Kocuria rhizophila]